MMKQLSISSNEKTSKLEISEEDFSNFIGKRIGDTVSFKDLTYVVTGGSTSDGTPMCKAIVGTNFKKICYKSDKKRRCGNTINENVVVVNCKLFSEPSQNN